MRRNLPGSFGALAKTMEARQGECSYFDCIWRFGFGDESFEGIEGDAGWADELRGPWIPSDDTAEGRGITATPLQVHRAMTVIATGGTRRTLRGNGVSDTFEVVKPETTHVLQDWIRESSDKGARLLAGIPDSRFKIEGATYSLVKRVESFTGFSPSDSPKYVITVFVDEPATTAPASSSNLAEATAATIARGLQVLIKSASAK